MDKHVGMSSVDALTYLRLSEASILFLMLWWIVHFEILRAALRLHLN